MDRRSNVVHVEPGTEAEIGRWLWAIQDARARTLAELEQLSQSAIDWLPPDGASSIGTVLYHIALIEADWLYVEVLEQDYPPDLMALFPVSDRDEAGRLLQVQAMSLNEHLARLADVRTRLRHVFQQMDLAEFRRVRALPDYDVTPEWVLHHLMQHEAEHRSQIKALRTIAEQQRTR